MSRLPVFSRMRDIYIGADAGQEAWVEHFLSENNLDYLRNPAMVASPEQLRFMVALDERQVYVPCSDDLFAQFYHGELSRELVREYAKAWHFIATLVHGYGLKASVKKRILHLCRYRFMLYLNSRTILPSRLIKRLVGIVLAQTGEIDPFREKKQLANARMAALLNDSETRKKLFALPADLSGQHNTKELRWKLDFTELQRLLRVSTLRAVWDSSVNRAGSAPDLAAELTVDSHEFAYLQDILGPEDSPRKKILYLPDVSGGFIADLAIIRSLLRMGHQVILALKESFYFNAPGMWDLESDPALHELSEGMFILHNEAVTKNDLLQHLREHRLVVISDGTAEQLNLYRASVTFARAWKECDLIIAKGRRNAHVLLGTSHEFTRTIACIWREDSGEFHVQCKLKSAQVRQFTEKDIVMRADRIIAAMHAAVALGKSVMFYSAIIGSIPGQTQTAIELVTAFVNYLRNRMDNTFIINPAEHFEEGLDGDDLMFMWERVQRSGYLDVWRFQTVDDIETSFMLLDRKMPAAWLGKDATFSTGCTKEMHIALDVQRMHPELQIIGPAAEKFLRRREYGVGKYFDARISVS